MSLEVRARIQPRTLQKFSSLFRTGLYMGKSVNDNEEEQQRKNTHDSTAHSRLNYHTPSRLPSPSPSALQLYLQSSQMQSPSLHPFLGPAQHTPLPLSQTLQTAREDRSPACLRRCSSHVTWADRLGPQVPASIHQRHVHRQLHA